MITLPRTIDFTFRVVVLLLTVTIGMMFLLMGARAAMAANLKTTAMVYDEVFTVGDLFSGVNKDMANKVLGPAPQPGKDIVLNARTLMRIAVALDLPWRPMSSAEQVTIRRAATLIETDDIADLLKTALRDKGLGDRVELRFLNTEKPYMVLPQNQSANVEISSLDYDPQRGTFRATLMAPSRDNPLTELAVAGKVERIIEVPVLTKTLASGDIINGYDIDWVDIREGELQHDMILEADELVGMTPRRMLVSGKPVRSNELERPQLVERGDIVTIVFNDSAMTLTTQGKAMQSGAKGDVIRIVNISSNRTIDAFVESDGTVTVR